MFLQLTKELSDLKPGDENMPIVVAKLEKKFMKCSREFRESEDCYKFLSENYALIQKHPNELWSRAKASLNYVIYYILFCLVLCFTFTQVRKLFLFILD